MKKLKKTIRPICTVLSAALRIHPSIDFTDLCNMWCCMLACCISKCIYWLKGL